MATLPGLAQLRARVLHALPVMLVLVAAAAYPQINPSTVITFRLTVLLLDLIALIGLDVAMGYTGLLTIATGAIFGIGAYASAALEVDGGVPMIPSIVTGTVIAAVIGLALLAPALRVGRAAYAMLSLYMAAALVSVLQLPSLDRYTHAVTGFDGINALVRSTDTSLDTVAQAQQIYYWVLLMAAIAALLARRFTASHWGRALIAVRDDEMGAAAMGISPLRCRLLALGVSSFFAAGAGALFAHANESCVDQCNLSAGTFGIALSIFFFSALVVGGRATPWGPVLGVVGVGAFQVFAGDLAEDRRQLVYGVLLIGTVVLIPGGLAGGARLLMQKVRWSSPAPQRGVAERPASAVVPLAEDGRSTLMVDHVTVQFGGVRAVSDVSFTVKPGVVHALIGANGSGKTTVLNSIGGQVAPREGRIRIGMHDISGLPGFRRARLGLGRTFQTPRVAMQLSVLDNVLQGAFTRYRHGWLGLFVLWRRYGADDAATRVDAHHLLTVAGLDDRAARRAETLSHGERRLLEVARALITHPHVLLLDEPAAGLAAAEIDELARLVIAARDAGTAVLMVEHNLAFVRRVATSATVLERGEIIAGGSPEQVLSLPRVIETFVGMAA